MEKPMKSQIPSMDSIRELAEFWDTNDFTDFEDEFEEVNTESTSGSEIRIKVSQAQARAVNEMARSKGMDPEDLVRQWVQERVSVS